MQQIVTGHENLGLSLYGEFLTPEEELALIPKLLVPVPFTKDTSGRSAVQRYGDPRAYSNHIVSATIPEHFVVLGARLCEHKLLEVLPTSVTVNDYAPGDIIRAHIDAPHAGQVITVLSLGAPATMIFKLKDALAKHAVELPPRSVVQLRDEIRFLWTHELLPVTERRYSVVFRGYGDSN